MPLLIAANQIPIAKSQAAQMRKSGIYLLADSHPNLSRPCLTSCASPYHLVDCFETSSTSDTTKDKKPQTPTPTSRTIPRCSPSLDCYPPSSQRRLFAKPNYRTPEAGKKRTS